MKSYYINEKLFAIGAKFDVLDGNGNIAFKVEADKFDIGKNINVYDVKTNRKVLYMRQQIRIGAHRYIAYNENMSEVATIKKSFMIPEYDISGDIGFMKMESNSVLGRNYSITKNGVEIGRISKELTFGRDRYTLEVIDEEYTYFFIGLLVMVDMIRFHSDN